MRLLIYIIIAITTLFFSCHKRHVNNTSLTFIIKNSSNRYLNNLTIYFPDTTIIVSELKNKENTSWININSAYNYAHIKAQDLSGKKYEFKPKDYDGEILNREGYLIYDIRIIDTISGQLSINSILLNKL